MLNATPIGSTDVRPRPVPLHGRAGDPVVETYSKLADIYDDPANLDSCWGRVAEHSLSLISVRDTHRTVVDVGCGTGRELMKLVSRHPDVQFVGVEPAANMRKLAGSRAAGYPNVRVLDGRFESLPLETRSVDYLYSILAFHWTSDLATSVAELARVLRPAGEMDLTFIGRHNGREFIQKTTPVFFKYMTPAMMVEAVSLRSSFRSTRRRLCSRASSTRPSNLPERLNGVP